MSSNYIFTSSHEKRDSNSHFIEKDVTFSSVDNYDSSGRKLVTMLFTIIDRYS